MKFLSKVDIKLKFQKKGNKRKKEKNNYTRTHTLMKYRSGTFV